MLQLGQALGDGKAQAAALAAPGRIRPDKALRQLGRIDGQHLPGDVFQDQGSFRLSRRHGQVDAGAGHGVFAAVAQQIIQDPPEQAAVGQDAALLRQRGAQLQIALGQPLVVFAGGLPQQLDKIRRRQMDRDDAGGGLRGFDQVFRQLFQSGGLALQNAQIFPCFLGRASPADS